MFDPAAMDAALLGPLEMIGWTRRTESELAEPPMTELCGDWWDGLEGRDHRRTRTWARVPAAVLMQDVRRYVDAAAARAAVASLATASGKCEEFPSVDGGTARILDVRLPPLGDRSHTFGIVLRDVRVTYGFVVVGRYGTVVLTSADPPLPLLRAAAERLARYAAANP